MLITIITVTYNAQNFIEQAVDSYISQTYLKKELVIIDGKSTDRTLEVLKGKESHINILISESDQGIYDALNKGVDFSSGEIIGILHSDDFYAHDHVLENVAKVFKKDASLQAVYGDLQYVDRDEPNNVIRNWISKPYQREKFEKGWMPPHPALFIKKECFDSFGLYDLSFKSAADYDLILRFLYKNRIKVDYLPGVLVKMRVGGLSNKSLKNRYRANSEDLRALKINGVPKPRLVSLLKPLSKITQFWDKKF